MKFEELLKRHIGEWGRYQQSFIVLVSLPTLFTAMHALSWTFSAASLDHRCRLPNEPVNSSYRLEPNDNNQSFPVSRIKCSRYPNVPFSQYHQQLYDPEFFASLNASRQIQTDLGEYCVDGFIYDTSEIEKSAINEFEIVCGRGWIKAFIQSMYYVGQFLGSIFFGIIGDKYGRKLVFLFAILMQCVAGSLMAFVPNWISFAILRICVGFCHPGIFVIAVVIGMELVGPEKRKLASLFTGGCYAVGQVLLGGTAYFLRNYQHLQLAISIPGIIFIVYWWPVVSGVYYGLSMNPTFFGGHRYFTFMAAGFMEIPGLVLSYLTLDRWGRKTLCAVGYLICALALFSTLVVPESIEWLKAVQVIVSKMAITSVYATVYTFTPELFPTPVRNTALGSCSMMARVGAISASYASMWLVEISRVAVVMIFAACSMTAFVASLFLPETAGQPLPETFAEINDSKTSFIPLCCQKKPHHKMTEEEEDEAAKQPLSTPADKC